MKRILYFDWHSAATEFYRLSPLDYIKSDNFTITRSTAHDLSFATINGYDVIIIERPSSDASLNLIKLARDMKIKTIIDFDDDCLHLDEYNPMYSTYVDQKAKVIESITLADEVWVSTQTIKNSFKLYNRNIHVVPNAHNDLIYPVKDKKEFNYNKVAMWRGGFSHEGDMYDIGVPEKIIEMVNNNLDWKFVFLGQSFAYLQKRCGKNYISQSGASTVQFYIMMHNENPCLFFYPLADTVFNRSKSNIAFLESVYSGAAFFGNKNLPEFDKPGVMSMDDISKAFSGKYAKKLEKMNNDSWKYIKENLLLSKVNLKRKERLENI